jgi:ParB family chromosome partitioning protein
MNAEDKHRRRSGLGRGLDALFAEAQEEGGALSGPRTLQISQLEAGPFQPRRSFDEAELDRLAESIRTQGLLQPILVRPIPGSVDRFHIIAGERRWRAAQRARLHEVAVVVRDLTDGDALQIAIIENVQRQDLTALEEGEGYRRLMAEFGLTQDDVARAVGKSRSHVANTLRLMDLPEGVREMLQRGELSAGHGRALLACRDPLAAAREVMRRGLNVRQTEALARAGDKAPASDNRPAGAAPAKDADTLAIERRLEEGLGVRVSLEPRQDGSGSLTIHYGDFGQLDALLERLGASGNN